MLTRHLTRAVRVGQIPTTPAVCYSFLVGGGSSPAVGCRRTSKPTTGKIAASISSQSQRKNYSSLVSSSSSFSPHRRSWDRLKAKSDFLPISKSSFSNSATALNKDHYKTLELTSSASPKEIKDAFYKLSKRFHPDLNPGDGRAEEKFKAISAAYNVLGDSTKKKQYDRESGEYNYNKKTRSSDRGHQTNDDWSHFDADRMEQMRREQEQAWRRMEEANPEFYRKWSKGFDQFGRARGSEQRAHPDYEKFKRDYYGDRPTGNRPAINLGQVMVYSFCFGLILTILRSVFGSEDLHSPYSGRGPPPSY